MTNIEKQHNENGADAVSETRTTEVSADRGTHGDNEFKLTIRKLEMPVRPRGVLAE